MGSIVLNAIATDLTLTKEHINFLPAANKQSPQSVLLFGPFNPSGSSNLPADAITTVQLGAHALSVATALRVQDTAGIEEVREISPELIDAQARCLLEDIAIGAIKVGPLYTIDAVRVVAQIAADYSNQPLVLHLQSNLEHQSVDEAEPDDVLGATLELLLPAATVVIAEYSLLAHWQANGLLSGGSDAASMAYELQSYGASWVLITEAPIRPGQPGLLLFGPEQASANWPTEATKTTVHDRYGPLACALTVQLANGLAVPEAVEAAIAIASPMAKNSFRLGMGQLIIDRRQ